MTTNDFERACRKGDLQAAMMFMDKHPRTNSKVLERSMKYASIKDHIDVVKWLITVHDDKKSIHKSLNAACKHGHLQLVQYLHDYIMHDSDFIGDFRRCNEYSKYTKRYLLQLACIHGHLDIIEYMLDIYPDEHIHGSFVMSCKHGSLDVAKHLAKHTIIDDEDIYFSLTKAAQNAQFDVIQWLFDTYPEYCVKHIECAFDDACSSSLAIAQWLFDKNPQIELVDAFYQACKYGRVDVMQWLVQNISIDTSMYNDCFHEACIAGRLQVAQFCHAHSATGKADTLDYVCENDHIDVFKWLVQSNSIDTPFDVNHAFLYACNATSTRIARFLLETYPEIDIHANSESIFLDACVSKRTPVIKLFTEYSDYIASYHSVKYGCDMARFCGYMITGMPVESNQSVKQIIHNGLYITTIAKSDGDCIIKDVERVIAASKAKSARS